MACRVKVEKENVMKWPKPIISSACINLTEIYADGFQAIRKQYVKENKGVISMYRASFNRPKPNIRFCHVIAFLSAIGEMSPSCNSSLPAKL